MPIGVGVAIAFTVAKTTIDTIGQVKAGNAAKKIGDFNAAVAETQAQDALVQGKTDEDKFRQGVKGLIGSQRAGFAGQNVVVDQGSAVDVQADAAYLGELDALQLRTNAARESWGYKVQAQNARMGGQQAQTASRFGAAGTLLGGAASVVQLKYGFGSGGSTRPSTGSPSAGNNARFSY